MKPLYALVTVAALGFGVSACGGSGIGADPRSQASSETMAAGAFQSASSRPKDNDEDFDGNSASRYDRDDDEVLRYGRAAGADDRQVISSLLKHYYAAAAADDGPAVCSLLYPIYSEAVLESYGQSSSWSSSETNGCAVYMTRVFRPLQTRVAGESSSLRVTAVRLAGSRGLALLSFGGSSVRYIAVHRKGGAWKVDELFDKGLP